MQEPLAPVTVHVLVTPPTCGDALTKYEAGAPPLPAVTVTVADPSPATAVGAVGVPGIVSEICAVTAEVHTANCATPLTVLVPVTTDLK